MNLAKRLSGDVNTTMATLNNLSGLSPKYFGIWSLYVRFWQVVKQELVQISVFHVLNNHTHWFLGCADP